MAIKQYMPRVGPILHIVFALAVGGCSTPTIRGDKMVPGTVDVATQHAESVSVKVTGDATPDFLLRFNEAITQCIRDTRVFPLAEPPATAPLALEVTVLRMQSPGYAAQQVSSFCTLIAKWCLKKSDSGATICEKDIVTSSTHDAPDYIIGGMRTAGRDATEMAAAANVKQGIEWLAKATP